MSYFSRLFVRKADGTTINPAQEDGNIASIATNIATIVDKLVSPFPVRLENSSGNGFEDSLYPEALVTLPIEHHRVHDAKNWGCHEVIAIATTATQFYMLTTENSATRIHFGYSIDFNDGAGTFKIHEGADRTGTTAQIWYNRNRNGSDIDSSTGYPKLHKNYSSGTTNGTQIMTKRSGSGKVIAGSVGSALERVLKPNTKYILEITNNTDATNNVSVEFNFYTT